MWSLWALVTVGATSVACGVGAGSEPDTCNDPLARTLCPVAGDGETAFNGDGLLASATAFYLPSEARRGPDGLLYIMDFNNHRLRRVGADDRVTTIAGYGFHAGAIEGALATESPLENPIDFDFLADGRVVFVMYHDPRVFVIDDDGRLRLLAGDRTQAVLGNDGDGGPPLSARFIELNGIAVASDGAIYLSDGVANRVRVIRDGVINTLAGTGAGTYTGDGGPARLATLNYPSALAIAYDGTVYVTDSRNCVVRAIRTDGTIATVAGSGPMATTDLSHPDGIAVGPDGALYIGDRGNSRVRVLSPSGELTTIAGTGTRGTAGDGGPALDAELGFVSRVQLDSDGSLLISDQTNGRIRRLVGPL